VIWAIVVAAGSGTRFGGAKQRELLAGRPLVDWALEHPRALCDGTVLVVPPEQVGEQWPATDAVVGGGETRSDSVRAGLAAVPDAAGTVVVHDAARPLATRATFEAVIRAVADGADAAVPGVEIPDTVRRRDGGTLDRGALMAVQTPQAFGAGALRRAHAGGAHATDDAALVEATGGKVVLVPGDRRALKITTPDDLRVLEALIEP
jgi:2-C-methyl-D-erythritol 4-phosphate cytidylyltransferase